MTLYLLSTEWVDCVEEPIKYQALRPHFFSVGGVVGCMVCWWGMLWVVEGGWVVALVMVCWVGGRVGGVLWEL